MFGRGEPSRGPSTGAFLLSVWLGVDDLVGHGLGYVAVRFGGASVRWAEDGAIAVYEDCGGPVGGFMRAINGTPWRPVAMAIGRAILNTGRFPAHGQWGRWWYAHERAHVGQAKVLGPFYLPLYLLGLVPAALLALGRRDFRLLHDAHLMELLASRAAEGKVPGGRQRG